MALPKQVQAFLDRPLDRKDFLRQVGMLALALMGIGTLMKALQDGSTSGQGSGPAKYGK